jgi:D-alanine--poly(phosphoribitol) ligase subunit 1
MYEYNLSLKFQTIVQQHAEKTALWFAAHNAVSYAELNALANQIARYLLAQGVAANDVVCLTGTKSLLTFASMLACLKLGAVYAILDPDSPPERLRKILATCEPKLVIANDCSNEFSRYDNTDLPQTAQVTGAHPAYIMFTSGSTGFPKGAVMTHANVLNLIAWSQTTYSLAPSDVLTNVNPLYFDNSVFDFYSALFTGACLVPFTKDEVRDPQLLVEKIAAANCTLWFSVPSLLMFLQTMKATDGHNLSSIRRFVFGGEGYPKAKLKQLFETYPNSEFFNVYGPTECTCICSSYQLCAADFVELQGLPPLGQIANNFAYLILNDEGQRVPTGEAGELCLLGPNVGRGYYNDPERTAASFVQNPYNHKYQELMYKTGDLVRLNPADGKLYIAGRKDNQIKHQGYRIELEEIEAALACLDYVAEAAALHSNHNGLSRISAVITTREEFSDEQIRADLKRFLPAYMLPSAWYREAALPKNANGKVDRRQLAAKYL